MTENRSNLKLGEANYLYCAFFKVYFVQLYEQQNLRGQLLSSLMWPSPTFCSYSCSVGSHRCGRSLGTGLIELVTVAIRLISHIGSPSVCPGGPTVWQKGSNGGQHLLVLNASCHSSTPSCRRKDGSGVGNLLPFGLKKLLKMTMNSAAAVTNQARKWCASGQCRLLTPVLVLTLVVVGAQQESLICSQICCRARGWLDTCWAGSYLNKGVTADGGEYGIY